MLRYEVTHPVVNDGGMVMWRALGVSSWPTLAVVSPEGKLIAMLAGMRRCYVMMWLRTKGRRAQPCDFNRC